jgi:hypothetical protein
VERLLDEPSQHTVDLIGSAPQSAAERREWQELTRAVEYDRLKREAGDADGIYPAVGPDQLAQPSLNERVDRFRAQRGMPPLMSQAAPQATIDPPDLGR